MISVHLDDIRRADVGSGSGVSTRASVILRSGSRDRVTFMVRSQAQARIIAEAINAAVDPDAPLYVGRSNVRAGREAGDEAEAIGDTAARLISGLDRRMGTA